jgi:hypothetical protein
MAVIELSRVQKELTEYFAIQQDVLLAYLFGSQARRTAHPASDIDIAVLLAGQPDETQCFDSRMRLLGGLIEILRTNDVDVAILNHASASLRYRVLRDGALLFCRNHDRLIDFRLRTINEYLDFKPMLERHEMAILEKARKGELLNGFNPSRGALERYRQKRQRPEGTPEAKL